MRELTFVRPGLLEWREAHEPRLETDRDALVRPLAVATCDLDSAIVHGETLLEGPFAFGHEFVAEVVDLGDDVDTLRLGQRVAVPFQISCGTCRRCERGQTANCESVPEFSAFGFGEMSGNWGGAFSELVRIPYANHMLVPIPAGVTPTAVASAGDQLAEAFLRVGPYVEAAPGSEVLIVGGAGSTGLYAVAIASALGASRVDYVGPAARRRELAHLLGASTTNGDFPSPSAYPIVFDASKDTAGLALAIRSTEAEGTCSSNISWWDPQVSLLLELYTKGITLRIGRVPVRIAMPRALELATEGRIRPELVTEQVLPLDAAPTALLERHSKLVFTRT